MSKILTTLMLQNYLEPIIASCNIWEGFDLKVFIIANAFSGGFTQNKIATKNKIILENQSNLSKEQPVLTKSIEFTVCETEYARHGSEIVTTIFQNYQKTLENEDSKTQRVLIITAGGDGTSLEVQTSLLKIAFESKENYEIITNSFSILRLPFGTGNDGSDGRTLEDSLLRLTFPSHIELQKAVKVSCNNTDDLSDNSPWYSFNLASVGIDAYITHMTNKMKKVFPGDFYKLWVNLSCLFYRNHYKNLPMQVEFYDDKDNLITSLSEKIEFCLLGVSGNRTYGSNHKILPTEDNACITESLSLFTKLANMKAFEDGTHVDKNFSKFYTASKLVMKYSGKILVQLDGESYILNKVNFPLTMELTKPVIPVIICDNSTINKGTTKKL